MDDIGTEQPTAKPGAWQLPPLHLVVCEPLEDEARRSVSRKSDAELVEIYAIALRAHAAATTAGDDRQGEADYWHVLERAIVEEAARRPSFGQDEPDTAESGSRRRRRRKRKLIESLTAARAAELAGPSAKP